MLLQKNPVFFVCVCYLIRDNWFSSINFLCFFRVCQLFLILGFLITVSDFLVLNALDNIKQKNRQKIFFKDAAIAASLESLSNLFF